LKNLKNFNSWDSINESYVSYKWVKSPLKITSQEKSKFETKLYATKTVSFTSLSDSINFKYSQRYWDALKTRLTQNSIKFKYGNSSSIPKQWIYWSEKVIYSDQRALLSRNSEKDEVLAYYPLAYNGAELDKFWVIGSWEDPSGRTLLKEMTLKTFLSKSTKDLIEKEFLGESSIGKKVKSQMNSTSKKDYWTLVSIIACENFPENVQGMADVAQSIYNRYHVSGKPYGKTVSDIILAKGQYEPVTKGTKKGADWKNINSKEKAIAVYMKTKGDDKSVATKAINNAISAQSGKSYVDNAKSHVKTRTEFLASPPTSSSAAGPTERSDKAKNNSFFWNYAGKTQYYAKKDFSAKPIPSEVKMA
jgi:spore germination cell wall hydrolase CwlJ-like protein